MDIEGVARISLRWDGLLEFGMASGASVSLRDAKAMLAAARQLVQTPTPALVIAGELRHADVDAREYLGGNEAKTVLSAVGIVVDTRISRVLVNLFLKHGSLQYPGVAFDSEMEAVDWLRGAGWDKS